MPRSKDKLVMKMFCERLMSIADIARELAARDHNVETSIRRSMNRLLAKKKARKDLMSTDWNVHCLDCEDTHTFHDANHRVEEMAALCKHAAAIAALAPLMAETMLIRLTTG